MHRERRVRAEVWDGHSSLPDAAPGFRTTNPPGPFHVYCAAAWNVENEKLTVEVLDTNRYSTRSRRQ